MPSKSNETVPMATNIVDICQISPSGGAPAELLLPLLHSDMIWLPFHHTKFLFFYDFEHSCSKSFFLNDMVPNIKNSLSLTLKHFPPLAGKIIVPLSPGNLPASHYKSGDSIVLTIALSGADFTRLAGDDHFLYDEDFHCFIPQMAPPTHSTHFVGLPAAAIQVTLFPDKGISIGFNLHHAVADGGSLFCFVRAWASINKFNGDAQLVALGEKFSPCYDRRAIQDADRLTTECWNGMKIDWPASTPAISSHKYVHAKFVLSETVLRKLKNFTHNEEKPAAATRISSFVAATAYVWSCTAKFPAAAGETLADDEPEYFLIPADSRARLSPALPDTYFGNCLTPVLVESTHGILKGKKGFIEAAKAITEAVRKAFNSDRGSFDGFENFKELANPARKRTLVSAGSPTFDIYDIDFGWGRPQMFLSLITHQVFICRSRDGGVEIGLWMPKVQMEAFAANFNHGLGEIAENLHTGSKL